MPLTLLTGPAGSGKTGDVLERFAGSLEREPVLVLPTRADTERFEDELLARRPVALGGTVATFGRLFGLAAAAAGVGGAPLLTPAQRRAVVAAVVSEASLRALAEPARRRGFVSALDRFIADAQAALVSPARLAAVAQERSAGPPGGGHLAEAAGLYRAYAERRDRLGRSDRQALAAETVAGLQRRPAVWAGRPVFVHGFDDLTPAQLALIEALAHDAEVLVSVTHEPGRACLAARGRLVEQLERAAAARVDLPAAPRDGLLAHLERAFLTDAPERREPDASLGLLEAAGLRNEVEQVGAAIARLLRGGTRPDEVAVLVRSPDTHAGLISDVLGGFGVPVAVHAERPVTDTVAGRGLLSLVRAALTTRNAADLVAFLRCPRRAPTGLVDGLEREVRVNRIESVEEALARWHELGGRDLWELSEIREAAGRPGPALLERAARLARDLAEYPHHRRAPVPGPAVRADLAAAEHVAGALEEMADLARDDPALVPGADALVSLLEELRVPPGTASVTGRVEVMSPYRARARQFPHVFVLALQDGEFPRRRREDPFLTEEDRRAAGLPRTADQREEERYLFYVAITRATRRLRLSFRTADDEGSAASPSFFVDEVLDLLAPGAAAELTDSKRLADTVFAPAGAPSERELARSLAERRLEDAPPALGASEALAGRLAPRLRRARRRAERLPGSLRVPFVRERFAAKELIGASSLETHAECSFRYFVDHELRPRELAPEPEPLARGAMTHAVLERVYRERGRRPTPADLPEVIELARRVLAESARGTSLDPGRAAARAVYRRIESDVARFIRYDAERADGALFGVEAAFGEREEDERPPLELGGFRLHGKIDRIDTDDGGRALIRDYKTGTKVAAAKEITKQSKLQLPLYMLAVRELWGLEPLGGVYHPLGKQYDEVPRGLLRGPRDEFSLRERFTRTDFTADSEEFDRRLADARAEAERLAARIHAGHLARDPLEDKCPRHCDFHPICRRERGEKNPADNGRREDEDE